MYLDPYEVVEGEKGKGDNKGGQLFYKLTNLHDRVKNADQVCDCVRARLSHQWYHLLKGLSQYLTVDIQAFSNKLAAIYSNITKPVLDVSCMWNSLS